ncbi:MAG: hypothetical protein FH758_12635 [Firmicutes bacterium]|nr:hypothetical protein [Bacillota bacterium]
MNETNKIESNKFLNEVENIAEKIEELIEISPRIKEGSYPNQLNILIEQLKILPENELIEAYTGLKDMPGWIELPDRIDDVIEKVKKALDPRPLKPSNIVITQANCNLGACPDGPTQVQVDKLLIAVASADVATALAQATADTIAIFSERGGKIAQAIASGLDVVGKSLALAATIEQRDADKVAECEDEALKRLLLSMCNTINDINHKADQIIDKLEIIDQKLDVIINLAQEIKEVVDEILLHQIEEALTECMMLVSLYLPEDTFGSIGRVQNIVKKLIEYAKTSGITVANAESYWRQGSNSLSTNQYEKALGWFMLAYKQLQNKDIFAIPCSTDPCKDNRGK